MFVDTPIPAGAVTAPAPPARRETALWASRTCWWWPALLTAALGLYQVTQPELWRDELSSYALADRGVSSILAGAGITNGAQAPYYLVLHFWIAAFGPSLLSIRGLSVLAMAGAAAFVTLAARELAGTRAALAAGFIFAVIPSVSRFAQEVRFYALAMLFAALATWLLIRALDHPSWARWAGYAAALAATGYMDIVAMSMLAGHGSVVALRWWRGRDPRQARFAAAAAASVAACAPVILVGAGQASAQVSWVPRPDVSPVGLGHFGANLFYSGPVAAAVLVLAILAFAVQPRVAVYPALAAVVPLAAAGLVSEGSVSYFFARYLLFTLISLAIAAGVGAAGLGRLRVVPAFAAVPVTAAIIAAVAVSGAHDQSMIRRPDAHNWANYPYKVIQGLFEYAHASRIVGVNARPGDGIAYASKPQQWEQANLGVAYYLGEYLRPGVPAPRLLFTAKTPVQANSLYPVLCADAARCIGHESRVWVVGDGLTRQPLRLLPPGEAAVLRQRYTLTRVWHSGGMVVGLLVRRA